MDIIKFLSMILLILGMSLLLLAIKDGMTTPTEAGRAQGLLGAFMCIFALAVLSFGTTAFVAHPTEIDRSAYTYYLDGTEVSSNTIDVDLYKYKYDDKQKKVYLTHK